jgi:hypothetical protein
MRLHTSAIFQFDSTFHEMKKNEIWLGVNFSAARGEEQQEEKLKSTPGQAGAQ